MHKIEINSPLVCPICKSALNFEGGSLACGGARRHNFDRAKSGYVNLNTHLPTSGDDKAMAAARQSFLRKGYYLDFANAVVNAAGSGGLVVDAGCGEGYYTELCAKNFSAALGVDLSKYALDLAAKSAKAKGLADKLFYAAASVYSLPLADESADCVVNIFAPCVEEEYTRVLKNGGRLVIAAAGKTHLHGLKAALYDTVTENEERRDLPKNMQLCDSVSVTYEAEVKCEDIWQLFMMTPYFYRTPREAAERLHTMESLKTVFDFEIRTYIKGK